MINISESQEDNICYFFINFDEYMNGSHKEKIESFWSEKKHFFDDYIVEDNYVMFQMTNLINPNAIYNVRKLLNRLKESLLAEEPVEELFSFTFNKRHNCYELTTYPLNCPNGFHEDGDKCSLNSGSNVGKFPQCEIGFKWHDKLCTCLPERNMPNVPKGYYWDFESHSCLTITSFKFAKLRNVLKNSEVESVENNVLWKIEQINSNFIVIDCSLPKELSETWIYNFYKDKWKSYKTKVYIEIGKSLRENYRTIIESVNEEDGKINIILNEDKDRYFSEMIVELNNQLSFYWNNLIDEIKVDESLLEIMSKKEDKVYLKLEDSSTILVKPDILDLIKC